MWRMLYTIVRNLFLLPKILETLHRMTDRPDLYSRQEVYDYIRSIIGLMKQTGHIRTKAWGQEDLPQEGGYILCPNHQGKYDAFSIVDTHDRPLTLVMDRERSYFVFISEIVDALGGKRMDITSSRHALTVIRQVAQEAREGLPCILFPEGGYDEEKKNRLWDFKAGSFQAATKAGVPIVPVALVDSWRVYGGRGLGPVTTQVHYLAPIPYEEYQDLSTHQIAQLVRDRIAAKLTQLGITP